MRGPLQSTVGRAGGRLDDWRDGGGRDYLWSRCLSHTRLGNLPSVQNSVSHRTQQRARRPVCRRLLWRDARQCNVAAPQTRSLIVTPDPASSTPLPARDTDSQPARESRARSRPAARNLQWRLATNAGTAPRRPPIRRSSPRMKRASRALGNLVQPRPTARSYGASVPPTPDRGSPSRCSAKPPTASSSCHPSIALPSSCRARTHRTCIMCGARRRC